MNEDHADLLSEVFASSNGAHELVQSVAIGIKLGQFRVAITGCKVMVQDILCNGMKRFARGSERE
jgi:hypothetical protein